MFQLIMAQWRKGLKPGIIKTYIEEIRRTTGGGVVLKKKVSF
jgi:hypothetical protein